ncbi:MAPK regulated corepressor interacting protein 2-like isoform X1 [Ceratina calcarata]|uniref:MAPK regulated corepressor interacting protein 2-like isoform X1 n=1 Tax=Ceratina calcarata TaxID=156304 RepID=A0AAJ7WEH0_9HYME|nr:MAPK regulated corepressor interacting protein 2-like isoform X1 [Ceratina calcarata]
MDRGRNRREPESVASIVMQKSPSFPLTFSPRNRSKENVVEKISEKRILGIHRIGRSQITTMNGKRPSSIPSRHQSETVAQHFDLIKYIYDSWNTVSRELDMCHNQLHSNSSNSRNGASVTYYQEREPNPQLKDFEPFNLEAWWGQRVVQSITRNANS